MRKNTKLKLMQLFIIASFVFNIFVINTVEIQVELQSSDVLLIVLNSIILSLSGLFSLRFLQHYDDYLPGNQHLTNELLPVKQLLLTIVIFSLVQLLGFFLNYLIVIVSFWTMNLIYGYISFKIGQVLVKMFADEEFGIYSAIKYQILAILVTTILNNRILLYLIPSANARMLIRIPYVLICLFVLNLKIFNTINIRDPIPSTTDFRPAIS